MKKFHSPAIFTFLLLFIASLSFMAFSGPKGGESVEIYLDDNLVVKQFINSSTSAKKISVNPSEKQELRVFYNHCGKVGNDRKIYFMNNQEEVIKTWRYANDNKKWMKCPVNGIPMQQRLVRLYYKSKEIPQGILLAYIAPTDRKADALP